MWNARGRLGGRVVRGAGPEAGAGGLEAIFEGASELLSFGGEGGRNEGDARAQVALWSVCICRFMESMDFCYFACMLALICRNVS